LQPAVQQVPLDVWTQKVEQALHAVNTAVSGVEAKQVNTLQKIAEQSSATATSIDKAIAGISKLEQSAQKQSAAFEQSSATAVNKCREETDKRFAQIEKQVCAHFRCRQWLSVSP
jgi:hypothetical protein